jgi:hypothetical protein
MFAFSKERQSLDFGEPRSQVQQPWFDPAGLGD